MKTPSRAPLIAAIVLVLAVLAGFNALNEKFRPKTEHEMEAAEAEAAQTAESKDGKSGEAGKTATPTPAPSAAAGSGATNSLAQLGPDAIVGDKSGSETVTIGWMWTPDVQGDPNSVARAIDFVKKAAPNAKIRVVNTDEVSGVPEGVSVDGKVILRPDPDGSFTANENAYQGVVMTLKSGGTAAP